MSDAILAVGLSVFMVVAVVGYFSEDIVKIIQAFKKVRK